MGRSNNKMTPQVFFKTYIGFQKELFTSEHKKKTRVLKTRKKFMRHSFRTSHIILIDPNNN
jgi:hypothetical protein